MTHCIRVTPSHGTTDWRMAFEDGTHIYDIRLTISSMVNASRYYITEGSSVVKEGTFNFGVWDLETMRDTLTAIVRTVYPNAQVTVELPQQRAAGS